nr:MAG TPA: hypothetical protein [Herelleviridae sp.]
MKKVESTHSKPLSNEDLLMWAEAITQGTVNNEEITEEQAKQLDRIGKRSISVEEVTTLAKAIAQTELQVVTQLPSYIDVMMVLLKDKLGVTDDDISEAVETINKKQEEYIKEKEEELRQRQEQFKQEEKEDNNDEKVIELKPKNDKQ